MTKDIVENIAESENLRLNGDLAFFKEEFSRWLCSVEHMFNSNIKDEKVTYDGEIKD